MTEIDDLLGMTERPCGFNRPAGMAGIGGRGGVALGHGCAQFFGFDLAREASVAEAKEASVPSRGWHPHLDGDVGVGCGRGHGDDAAEGGQLLVEIALVGPRERVRRSDEHACGIRLRRCDLCTWQREWVS